MTHIFIYEYHNSIFQEQVDAKILKGADGSMTIPKGVDYLNYGPFFELKKDFGMALDTRQVAPASRISQSIFR
jgi:hypothetical protein